MTSDEAREGARKRSALAPLSSIKECALYSTISGEP